MSWYLQKEWLDREGGIDEVVIHYTWSPRGHGADFGAHHESRALHEFGDGRRAKVLAMPRAVWDGSGWNDEYTFHHVFEIHQSGGSWTTDVFSEDIVCRELEYVDDTGFITNICVHWGVGDWTAPVYSPMDDPRFPEDSEFASIRYYAYWDKPRFHHAKAEMLAQIPLPHLWRAKMWGPQGSTIVQQYHIGHMYPEHEQSEVFLGPDGPTVEFGSSWTHLL